MVTQNHEMKRCAIYTRKSTEEGLEQDFNTLDAQREAGEACVVSQQELGWRALPDRYDDGGYSGGHTDRPALRRLLADIQLGKVDCVIVYKVDRLSRSLLDFARIMEVFDERGVAFVAVTQQFNTSTSIGRLILHVLLSFAQFERELISERTRDKMGAARRKGKWLGSMPVLGYDIDRTARRLVVNHQEGERVRKVFELCLEARSLLNATRELRRRGWHNKRWITSQQRVRGGRPFTKATLQYLLTNVTYLGLVRYRGETYPGEHEAIVPQDLFDSVQRQLQTNGHASRQRNKTQFPALLRGRLFCSGCHAPMTHTYTSKGNRRYRYYVCSNAQRNGYDQCHTRSVPAGEIEQYVRTQLREFLQDRGQPLPRGAEIGNLIEQVTYDGQLGQLVIQFSGVDKQ